MSWALHMWSSPCGWQVSTPLPTWLHTWLQMRHEVPDASLLLGHSHICQAAGSRAAQPGMDGSMLVLSQYAHPFARMQTAGTCLKRVCSCMSPFMMTGLGY